MLNRTGDGTSSRLVIGSLLVAATLVVVPAWASEEQPEPEEESRVAAAAADEEEGEEALSFTNEDLPKTPHWYRHPSRVTADGGDDGEGGEGEARADGDEEEVVDPEQRAAELQKIIQELRAQNAHLKKRRMALKNPFLAGATPAQDDEKDNVGGQNAVARISWVDAQIAANKQSLDEAQAELQELRSATSE